MHLKLKIPWEDMDALADGANLIYETETANIIIEVLHYNSFSGESGIEVVDETKDEIVSLNPEDLSIISKSGRNPKCNKTPIL